MRNQWTILSAGALALALADPAGAQPATPAAPAPADTATVVELVAIALRDNPELAAARAGAEAAAARPGQATSLPDPVFTYGWMGEHLETVRGPQSSIFGVSQEIPFFGKRGLAGEVATHAARATSEEVRAMELEVAAQVRQSAAELLYLDAARAASALDRRLVAEILDIARTRYETGRGRLEDVARAEVELATNEREGLDLALARDVEAVEMNRLLGRPPDAPLPPLGDPLAASPDSIPFLGALPPGAPAFARGAVDSLVAARPELEAAAATIAGSEAARRLAGRAYWPDLMLGFQYYVVDRGDSTSPEAGMDAWMIEFGVSLPIWLGARNAGVREAEAMRAEGLAARSAAATRIRSEIAAAAARVRRTAEIAALYRTTIIPRVEIALASARSGYQTGQVEFGELLDSERALVGAHLALARARADLTAGAADLARATGRPLPTAPLAPAEGDRS